MFSNSPMNPNDDYWDKYRPVSNTGRSLLYRYEHEGILVYDCFSRLSTESSDMPERSPEKDPTPLLKKDLEGTNDFGNPYIDRAQYLNMKSYPPNKQYVPEYTLVAPQNNTLKFDSKFESGNLHKAIKVSESEYNLLLNYDTETKGHTQWYYFSIKPFKADHTVRFNIINLMKFESLYNSGMKPLIYSEQQWQRSRIGWHRDCSSIGYYQNSHKRKIQLAEASEKSKYYYTLTFTYNFRYENDTVYFAYSYPYTYSDLSQYLTSLKENPKYSSYLRVNPLCKTIAGNICYILTITKNVKSYTPWEMEDMKLKKTTAGRRYIKLKEMKEESKLKIIEIVKGNRIEEGKK